MLFLHAVLSTEATCMTFAPYRSHRPAISLTNSKKEILFVNEACMEILGYRMQDLIGHNWGEFMVPEEFQRTLQLFDEFLQTKRPYTIQMSVLRCDGKPANFVAQCSVMKTLSDDLLLSEMFFVEEGATLLDSAQFQCAEMVRDVTYELAAMTGRNKLDQLTNSLIETSSSAERALGLLSKVPGLVR